MIYLVDVISAIKRPFTDVKNLIIGLIVFNIPIINSFAPAYFFRCIRGTYQGNNSLPDWKNIKGLLMDWVSILLIGFIYMTIPILLFLVSFFAFEDLFKNIREVYQGLTLTNFYSKLSELFLLIISNKFFLLIIILSVIAFYLIVITYLIVNDKKAGKLNWRIILKKALTLKYFIAFILIMILRTVFDKLISLIPYVGDGISNFILGVISFTLFAQIYLTIPK